MTNKMAQRLKTAESYALVALVFAASIVMGKIAAQDAPATFTPTDNENLGPQTTEDYEEHVAEAIKFAVDLPDPGSFVDHVDFQRVKGIVCFNDLYKIGLRTLGGKQVSQESLQRIIGQSSYNDIQYQPEDYGAILGEESAPIGDLQGFSQVAKEKVTAAYTDCAARMDEGAVAAHQKSASDRQDTIIRGGKEQIKQLGAVIKTGEEQLQTLTAIALQPDCEESSCPPSATFYPQGGPAALAKAIATSGALGTRIDVASLPGQIKSSIESMQGEFSKFSDGFENPTYLTAIMTDQPMDGYFDKVSEFIGGKAPASPGGVIAGLSFMGSMKGKLEQFKTYVDTIKGTARSADELQDLISKYNIGDKIGDEEAEEDAFEVAHEAIFCQLLNDTSTHEALKAAVLTYIGTLSNGEQSSQDVMGLKASIEDNSIILGCETNEFTAGQHQIVMKAAEAADPELLKTIEELRNGG